jgi:hypothetical protein
MPAGRQRTGTQLRAVSGFSLNISVLGNFARIIHFNAQVADRAFQLPVAQQQLNGTEVPGFPVDQRDLGASVDRTPESVPPLMWES